MHKIIALIEQRLALHPRQSIAETIAKIQLRRVPAALAEISISLPRDPCMFSGEWLYLNARFFKDRIEPGAQHRVLESIYDNASF